VISAGSAIAYVIYRLCRNFFKFCDSYREDEIAGCDTCIKELSAIYERTSFEQGDVLLVLADSNNNNVLSRLGALRVEIANRLNIKREGFKLLWVVEFPFFDFDQELGDFVAMHHPFTSPLDECIPLLDTDKAAVRAKAYDLVLNGIELASGSIRITDPALQKKMFDLLGLSEEESKRKFGYLLDAFRYGAPPHGGMALGLDRLVMQLLGADSLRDVVAFPKVQNASELLTSCPSDVPQNVLDELGLEIKKDKE
jgi:aspartyl-tRNA synthetase